MAEKYPIRVTFRQATPEERAQWAEQDRQDRELRVSKIEDADPLTCDECGKHLGRVYDFDMNGNIVVCDACYERIRQS